MNLFSSRHSATIAAGSLVAIVSATAVAQAATDTIYKYSTPKIGNFSINPFAMSPTEDGVDYSTQFIAGGFIRLSSGTGCFSTGVNLPNGATMTRLTTFWTSGAGPKPGYTILRHTLSDGATVIVATGNVNDDTGTRKPFSANIDATAALVNNNQHSYTFVICMGGLNDAFHGARVSYTYTSAGD